MKHLLFLLLLVSPIFSQSEEIPEPLWTSKYQAWDVAFSPDGNLLAVGNSQDSTCYIVDSFTGEELYLLKHEYANISQVLFSPDGKILASACLERRNPALEVFLNRIVFWDTETWEKLYSIEYEVEGKEEIAIYSMDFSPNGEKLAVGLSAWGFSVIDMNTREVTNWNETPVVKVTNSGEVVRKQVCDFVSISYDNKYLMASFSNWERVKIFDLETLEEVKEYIDAYRGDFNPVKDEFLIQEIQEVSGESWHNILSFYNENIDEPYKTIIPYNHGGDNVEFVSNGSYLMHYRGATPKLYDYISEREVVLTPFGGLCMDYNSSKNLVAGNGVYVYDISTYLGVESLSETNLSTSPNPASEIVNINYHFDNPTEFIINIHDITGNLIATVDSGLGIGDYNFDYHCQALAQGTYIITLQLNEGQISKQFIKE